MPITIQKLFLAACLTYALMSYSQNKAYTSFTVNDGLPSNNVYRVKEDSDGFLWIITDAGVARFDGKYFKTYTTRNGLPDNEILYIEKEKDGRIWLGPYRQVPTYFDPIKNRFVMPLDQKTLLWFENTLMLNLKPIVSGGICYSNNKYLIFKNGQLDRHGDCTGKWNGGLIRELEDGSSLFVNSIRNKKTPVNYSCIYYYRADALVDSIVLEKGTSGNVRPGNPYNGNVYLWSLNTKECTVISHIEINPLRFKRDTIRLPEPALNILFSEKSVYFSTYSGKLYVYDTENFSLQNIFYGDYLPNGYGEDSKGNQYITTVDKGLLVYRHNALQKVEIPDSFTHTNFISIAQRKDGTLFAGNYYGEIAEFNNGKFSVHATNNIVTSKIRKILFSGNNVFTFSEQGIYRNYTERIVIPRSKNLSFAKNAISYNDSIIIVGTHYGLVELNTRTLENHELFPGIGKESLRITALTKAEDPFIYFGSIRGLYRYNYKTKQYVQLKPENPALNDRITTLGYTGDGLLWVATSSNKILVFQGDNIIDTISLENDFNVIRHIIGGKPGQIWISGSGGIQNIRYTYTHNTLTYNTVRFSVNEGLQSNDVQEIIYNNGTIYAATGKGITIIPENRINSATDIPTYLVNMRINQRDTVILNRYQLKHNQQDVQMQFAGVDLDGRFNYLQYKLDSHKNWTNLYENTLNMQLRPGDHTLQVRAVDVNGHISNKVLTIYLNVAVPFWQNIWFLGVLGLVLQLVLFYFINRYQKRRREAELSKKINRVQTAALEQQAFTSLMNPHFIFNALNSIQHYINMQDRKNANRYLSDFASLIRKNFDAALLSFIPLEEEIENIKIYLNLERMRFSDRLSYSVTVDKDLEPEDWMIPVMVLQPLLENALLHGIMPSLIPGEITVFFGLSGNDLQIIIADNGIGLQNSRILKKDNNHKSSGIILISKRIKALGNFGTRPPSIGMEPVTNSNTNPGNRVTLIIPDTLYNVWRSSHQSL